MPDRGDYSQLIDPFLTYRATSREHPDGKSYRVPFPDIATGMRLTSLGEVAQLTSGGVEISPADLQKLGLADLGADDVQRMTLGPAYDEMVADGVFWPVFRDVFRDAFTYFSVSPQVADSIRAALAGEAAAPERSTPSPQPTRKTKGGSKSSRASSATRGRTPSRASTRSSTSMSDDTKREAVSA